jgi:hypothetical protein
MVDGGSPASECAQAAWHRHRPFAHVISRRCTVATTLASDCWVFWRLGVRVQPGYGRDDVAHECGVAREHALWRPNRFE